MFTVHPSPELPLDEQLPDHENENQAMQLRQFVIPKERIFEIQQGLYLLGIRHGRLFPDMDGHAMELKIRHHLADCHHYGTVYDVSH